MMRNDMTLEEVQDAIFEKYTYADMHIRLATAKYRLLVSLYIRFGIGLSVLSEVIMFLAGVDTKYLLIPIFAFVCVLTSSYAIYKIVFRVYNTTILEISTNLVNLYWDRYQGKDSFAEEWVKNKVIENDIAPYAGLKPKE